ncbi:flagellar basal-body MS-ring/collar protein FliF [uncultured Clostridium sp.]|jgi:flagellar M-ring protein FliF|uniref:flagellar basal-body MS-ring/collar protein FliF n=1 Tax=uncultured Clostridium sp. TaxID=59620 RepID=UPI0026234477|nr:flagellar basal-body MS-ring/collar protein FliF [uncultured Clostridium sp.]
MEKVKGFLNSILEKFKAMGRVARISIIVALISIIIGIILAVAYSVNSKYQVLFTGLEGKDAKMVTEKLKELKVDLKVKDDTILVPKKEVDSLRLELAPSLSGGSIGYELMDEGSSFGITSEEFALKKLRMTQGEIEKTIKSFPQIENARVHITLPKETVFVDETEDGKAAAYIELKYGESLEPSQVKSIVALISSSVSNIPKENIEVVDQNMKLLSEGIFSEEGEGTIASGEAISNQRKLEADYEKELESSVYDLLNPVIGSSKIKTQISVELDFDSKQKTEVTVDPNKVIKNQTTIKESNGSGAISTGPVDDNMSNNIEDTDGTGSNREEQSTEYEIGKTEVKNISAPGEVKRVTASVVIDGKLDKNTIEAIKELVGTAIGYKQGRGDQISVLSMTFDQEEKEAAKEQLDLMAGQAKTEKITKAIVIGVILVIAIILLAFLVSRVKRKKDENEEEEDSRRLNVVIDDDSMKNFDPIDFDIKDEKTHVESEIKNYANKKPEQVADVIKSWLNEEER